VPTNYVRELPKTLNQRKGMAVVGANNMLQSYRGNAMYMGEPDGPMRFIKSLGEEVPTYIDPRNDLKTKYKTAGAHKSVDYHIPPRLRGPYKPEQLADYDPDKHYAILSKTNFVRCGGIRSDGQICQKTAMHRTGFCSNHGGALHPADKLFASERGVVPTSPEKLDRMQKVEMGIIPVSDLSDEEIARQQVKLDNGTFGPTSQILSARIINAMRQEFFSRADRFVRENVLDMLEEMRNIAISTVSEDKDKITAATWLIERAMGKTPDVLITNKTDSPFESMMGDVFGGSRDDYRNGNTPAVGGMTVIEGEIADEPVALDEEEFDEGIEDDPVDGVHSGIAIGTGERDKDEQPDPKDPIAIAKARAEKKAAIKRRRNRQYAAKSRGLSTLDDLPYEIVFKKTELKEGTVTRMKLLSPEQQKMR